MTAKRMFVMCAVLLMGGVCFAAGDAYFDGSGSLGIDIAWVQPNQQYEGAEEQYVKGAVSKAFYWINLAKYAQAVTEMGIDGVAKVGSDYTRFGDGGGTFSFIIHVCATTESISPYAVFMTLYRDNYPFEVYDSNDTLLDYRWIYTY